MLIPCRPASVNGTAPFFGLTGRASLVLEARGRAVPRFSGGLPAVSGIDWIERLSASTSPLASLIGVPRDDEEKIRQSVEVVLCRGKLNHAAVADAGDNTPLRTAANRAADVEMGRKRRPAGENELTGDVRASKVVRFDLFERNNIRFFDALDLRVKGIVLRRGDLGADLEERALDSFDCAREPPVLAVSPRHPEVRGELVDVPHRFEEKVVLSTPLAIVEAAFAAIAAACRDLIKLDHLSG